MRDGGNATLETFTYSPTGDRTSKQLGSATPQTYSYVTGTHRLANAGGGTRNYDANGNTTGMPELTGYPLVYDDRNRLAKLSINAQGSRADFHYLHNGLGQRATKLTPTTAHDAIYGEAGQRLSDIDWNLDCGSTSRSADRGGATNATSNCVRSAKGRTDYLYLDGLPIAVARYPASGLVPQLSYLETDHLGTPRVAVDASTQAIQWRWDLLQTAFGDHAATPLVSGFELNLRYPGQYFDSETGLHYNRYRDYEPRTGRYTQSDLIGLDGGMDRYSYVAAQPLQQSDSLGLACDSRGCWNAPEETARIEAGDPYGYYSLACKGGDPYACRAFEVSTNSGEGLRGLLSSITNWKLALGMSKQIPTGCPDYAMKEMILQQKQRIRLELAQQRFQQLRSASPIDPIAVTRESISDFHQDIFSRNGASPYDFGGDLWDIGKYFGSLALYDWCEKPSCS